MKRPRWIPWELDVTDWDGWDWLYAGCVMALAGAFAWLTWPGL